MDGYKFKVGDKLICVRQLMNYDWLIEGNIYTINRIEYCEHGTVVRLDELPHEKHGSFTLEMWFEPYNRLEKILKLKERICTNSVK